MDIIVISSIIVSFIVGATFMSLFKKGSKGDTNNVVRISTLENENSELKERLSKIMAESEKYSNSEKKMEELKSKYEKLLEKANEQCAKLNLQLKCASKGMSDDVQMDKLAEIEKQKKIIKELEEEIEENEDDISDLKKKLKSKDSEIVELQDNLGKEQKIGKKMREELSSVKQALEDKMKELQLKMESLDFLQEILSAKEISTADINKLYKSIDFFESFVKGQFTDLNSYLYSTYDLTWNDVEGKECGFEEKKKYFFDGFEQWASTKRKNWLDGKTTIAFVGEFSAGKTSVVNRILSQDNPNVPRLPVSTKATTAIPTYIAGGSTVSYSFISGDAKRKIILEDTFIKVSKDILEQIKGVSSLIKYFVMTYKNPNLDGLSILDTPGFNSNDAEDRERTIDVINECDALFWVFDVNAGTVNRSSISIIKENLHKPLYVVINKVDTKPESEVRKVENLIKKTLSDAGLQVQQYIRFSAKAPLASIMNPIKTVNKIASRDTFVSDVGNDIEQLLNILDDAIKSYNTSYANVYQEGEEITDEFFDCMKELQSDCETAYNIPQWVEHIFSEDRFEMSDSEGEELRNLLEHIANNRVTALAEKFNKRVEKAGEIQQQWSDLCSLKEAWQKTNDCYEQYKKYQKIFGNYESKYI